jgi:non-specific serine/threonine protein kinase
LVYLVGGTPGSGLFVYDPATDAWDILIGPVQDREHTAAVALGSELWVLGGRWGPDMLASVEIYDPATGGWSAGPGMNEARSGFGSTVVDGLVLVAGGEVFEPTRALDSVESLEPGQGAWQTGTPLPMGIHGNPLVTLDGIVYLPAGSIQAAGVDNPGQLFAMSLR